MLRVSILNSLFMLGIQYICIKFLEKWVKLKDQGTISFLCPLSIAI